MNRVYYPINEELAQLAHEMRSLSDYRKGIATARYQSRADEAWELAEQIARKRPEQAEKAYQIADRYAKKMADNMNAESKIAASCPSVLIAGPAGVNPNKKAKQLVAMERNQKEFSSLHELLNKLQAMLNGTAAIKTGDSDAIMRLEKKVKALSDLQEHMKAVNMYYKKCGDLSDCPYCDPVEAAQLMQDVNKDWNLEKRPFQSFTIQNNGRNLRTAQKRLEALKSAKQAGSGEEYSPYFKIVKNADIMRLQLFFDGKPDDFTRSELKKHGFHWSPSNQCWQRQLNQNGIYAMKRLIEALNKEKGE